MISNARLAVIVVNYGAADFIIRHLDKTLEEMRGFRAAHLYIVDNASPGDDLAALKEYVSRNKLEADVTVIDAGANLGFAGGNNLAFEEARGAGADYVFFLNPDAYPLPGALRVLYERLEVRPDAAIAGAQLVTADGEESSCCFRFPSLTREFASEAGSALFMRLAGPHRDAAASGEEAVDTDWVSGTAFMLRAAAADAKLMDDGFFLYYEETDMMLGLKRRGWKILHAPAARVVHIGAMTTGVQNYRPNAPRLPDYWFDSWRYYYRKNHGALYTFGAALAKTLGVLAYQAKRRVRGEQDARPQAYLRDVVAKCLAPAVSFRGRDARGSI